MNNIKFLTENNQYQKYRRNKSPKENKIYKTYVYSKKLKKYLSKEDFSESSMMKEKIVKKCKIKHSMTTDPTDPSNNSGNS